jgi:hypothetical protein
MGRRLVVRPGEVRIWIREDGAVEWRGRAVSPRDMAIMGLFLQQSAVAEMGGVKLIKSPALQKKISAGVGTVKR